MGDVATIYRRVEVMNTFPIYPVPDPNDDGFEEPFLHEMWCSAVQYGEECNCQREEEDG